MVVGPIGMYFVTVNSGGMSFFHPISLWASFKIYADLDSEFNCGWYYRRHHCEPGLIRLYLRGVAG
jgi:hypothetical protein